MAAANQFAAEHGFADEYPFESHFVEVDGQKIHYIDEGAGETILCVHGNPTWSFAWRNVVRKLRDRYRVIAIDHLGCGLSSKPAGYCYSLAGHVSNLQSLVTQLDLNQITLFSHFWGGAIGPLTAPAGRAGRGPHLEDRGSKGPSVYHS